MSEIYRYSLEEKGWAIPDKEGWLVDYDDHVAAVEDAFELKRREVIASVSQIIQDCLEDFLNEGENDE